MAFFKFRKGGDDSQATQRPPESVEAMRRRARHRLIGAVVLVLVGVIGFPLLFDTQPRPIAVDIPIEIPDRNKVKPLAVPPQQGQAAASKAPAAAPVVQAPQPGGAPSVAKSEAAPEPKAAAKPEPKVVEPKVAETKAADSKPAETKPEPKVAEAKPAAKSDDGAKARALLEGKAVDAAAANGRFVVQIGAFADAAIAQETRRKVEKAGLKTYTNVAETKDGKRIRVRVGPFGTKDEAAKAADKIKGLDLPAAVLTL